MPVRHSPPRSLAQRIMLSFALLVTFVAGFYAFALYQSIEFTEQQLISGILTCKSSKDHSKPRNEADTSLKSPV